MPLKTVFQLQNNFVDASYRKGICTAAALQWAKRCLKLGRGLNNRDELGMSDFELQQRMQTVRGYDNDPVRQTEEMGLRIVGGKDVQITTPDEVQAVTASTPPHISIFWNRDHTMGYRFSLKKNEYDLFDNNFGLYRTNSPADIFDCLRNNQPSVYQGTPILAVRVVELPDSKLACNIL